jgi:ribosomal protein S18 acetylase RimI-like enzyme
VDAVLRDRSKGFYRVALLGDTVVGQTMITFEWSDWNNAIRWWVQSVYVRPEARRQGVYRRLFESLLAEAKAEGVCGIRLYVHRENRAAQQVYQRLGFEHTHYHLYGLDL